MRRSTLFLSSLGLLVILLGSAAADAAFRRVRRTEHLRSSAAFVAALGLTDLCLFTEARYTRHPSQADAFAPFQDHPRALEHFPSGSMAAAPR